MPTLAAGNNKSPCRPRYRRGFTLLEVLVALVVVGVLATTISLALPDAAQSRQRDTVRLLADQLARAGLQAEAQGQPWRWLLADSGSRLIPPVSPAAASETPVVALVWPEGMRLEALEYEGRVILPGVPLRLGYPPAIYTLTLSGNGRRWQIDGEASGQVRITETAK